MNTRPVLLPAAALAVAALAGCKDSSAPLDPDRIADVFVGVRADRVSTGSEFVLGLIPVNGRGETVLSADLDVDVALTSSGAPAVQSTSTTLVPADSRPIAAAIHMDNSSSMASNDPDRVRDEAATLFWQTILGGSAANQVALLSFGGDRGTVGFRRTRLLKGWTANQTELQQALASAELQDGSDLYRSAIEVVNWIDTTRAATDRRVMLLFTDGILDDDTLRESLFAAAESANVQINTVGLGSASDASGRGNQTAIARLQEVANQTGGTYAGASDAASLTAVFDALATSSAEGELRTTVRLANTLPAGTVLRGTVSVANDKGGATKEWSFTVR